MVDMMSWIGRYIAFGVPVGLSARNECFHSSQFGDASKGAFWVGNRHYIVASAVHWFLYASADWNIAVETLLAAPLRYQADREAQLEAECSWGALSLALLGREAQTRTTEVMRKLVNPRNWIRVLRSGWPLFWQMTAFLSKKLVGVRNANQTSQSKMLRHVVQQIQDATAEVGRAMQQTFEPSSLEALETRLQHLFAKQRSAFQVEPISIEDSRGLLESLSYLQATMYLQGPCPVGTFIYHAHSRAVKYKMCGRSTLARADHVAENLVDKRIFLDGFWPDCEDVPRYLNFSWPNNTIAVDVGANIGACTLYFAAIGMKVVAIEPEPFNRNMLTSSLRIPQPPHWMSLFSKVSVAAVAVDEFERRVLIRRNRKNAGNSFITPYVDAPQLDTIDTIVDTKRLDDIALEHARLLGGGLENILALKVDIECAEYGALKGAPRLLASSNLRVIAFEFLPWDVCYEDESQPRHLLDMLSSNGFNIHGTQPVLEERIYLPSEFDSLLQAMRKARRLGTDLLAMRR